MCATAECPVLPTSRKIYRQFSSFLPEVWLSFLRSTNYNMADKWVDLSDDQIETLLAEAESRLSSKGRDDKSRSQPEDTNSSKPSASNVTTAITAATALNSPHPATSSDSKSKESLAVRVPEARKRKKEDVSICPPSPPTIPSLPKVLEMMKTISQFN